MLTNEIKTQFNEILEEIGNNLDITETQYKFAVQSYQAVGKWLADEKSLLAPYRPEIMPQGSFLLGTMIKPVIDSDELDVDLVCRLEGKKPEWAQYHLKKIVGDRLKENKTYQDMLDKEGRRCWTLNYSDSSKYHMDILPSIVSVGHRVILEKAFSATDFKEFEKTAIRITDNQEDNYYNETNPDYWNKSNPFGYAIWFQERCSISIRKSVFLSDSVKPMPTYQKEKLPLQRVVQILKRHRDIMFDGDDDKPISIIITTLSAKSYNKEVDITTALTNVVNKMESHIESKYSSEHRKWIKWISNPVNEEENFADKWVENPKKEENFYKWINKVKSDLSSVYELRGIHRIQDSFSKSFGESLTKTAFGNIADRAYQNREAGNLHMKMGSGILGAKVADSTSVKSHNFHGKNKK
ncbi:nucleotidyltransferase [uncultured Draconibacterium sp.]|uniref:nucleotidyltransferase domain-containing protein n=1 Tax=uncultured Draconibacterium sp. TaxID=1573823 RepID=UPI003217A4A2